MQLDLIILIEQDPFENLTNQVVTSYKATQR